MRLDDSEFGQAKAVPMVRIRAKVLLTPEKYMTIIEQKTYHAMSSWLQCRNEHPDHDTIAGFRKRFTSRSHIDQVPF